MKDKQIIVLNEITTKILNNDIKLDEKCWNCLCKTVSKGENKVKAFYDDNGICERCKGTGFILTDLGEAIIKLVERHRR